MNELTNLGVAGVTLAILFFIVRYFVSTLTKKDEYISIITKEFSTIVSNHLIHAVKAEEKMADSNQEVAKALLELKNEIRQMNNNNKRSDNS